MMILVIFLMAFVFIVIVDTEKRPRESQDLAECDEDGVMNFAGRGHDEAADQQTAANDNQQNCRKELDSGLMFAEIHNFVG